jgi:hypothetical protein
VKRFIFGNCINYLNNKSEKVNKNYIFIDIFLICKKELISTGDNPQPNRLGHPSWRCLRKTRQFSDGLLYGRVGISVTSAAE